MATKSPSLTGKRKTADRSSPGITETPMKRINSLPNLNVHADAENILGLMMETFRNKTFLIELTPIINTLIAPVLQSAIQTAVATAVNDLRQNVVIPLTQENDRLIQTVHKQCGTINELRQTIVEKNIQIQELENNQKLICEDMDEIRIGLNEAEQYSRRNAIRITNVPTLPPTTPERELALSLVTFFNEHVLKTGVNPDTSPIVVEDIERCYQVGKYRNGGMSVIVKFSVYRTKQRIFQAKSNLKGDQYKRFITEDLTYYNQSLMKTLLDHRRQRVIVSVWSRDGVIFAKKRADDRPTKICHQGDIAALVRMGRESGSVRQ